MPKKKTQKEWLKRQKGWKPSKLTKGCIRKVLELCKKTEKMRGEIADLGRYYKHELVDDRMIKLRPEEIEPWDKELAERTEAAQKVTAKYRKLVEESERIRKDCPGTRLVFDREHEKAYCTLSHEASMLYGKGEGYMGEGRKAWTSIALYKEKVKRRDPKWKRQLKHTDTFARGLGFSLKGHKSIKQWIDKTFRAPEREAKRRKTAIVPYTVPPPPIVYRTA